MWEHQLFTSAFPNTWKSRFNVTSYESEYANVLVSRLFDDSACGILHDRLVN